MSTVYFCIDTLKNLWLLNLLPDDRKLKCFSQVGNEAIYMVVEFHTDVINTCTCHQM